MRRRPRAWRALAAATLFVASAWCTGCTGGPLPYAALGQSEPATGSISGRVVLDGEIPRSWRADTEAWPGARSKPPEAWDGTPPREIEVDAGGGVRGVAVWLEPLEEATVIDAPTSSDEGRFRISIADQDLSIGLRLGDDAAGTESGVPGDPVEVRLQGSCFWPMTIVVPRGGTLRMVNADARLHHVQGLSPRQPRGWMIGPGESAEIALTEPDRVRLTCNDHAFMRADLIVTPGPWAAVTDATGLFEISGVPEGSYRLRFAHHRLGEVAEAPSVAVRREATPVMELHARRGQWEF